MRRLGPMLGLLTLLSLPTGCAWFGGDDDSISDSGLYGAVAYSGRTGRWSIATDRPDPETARRDAVKACAETDCTQVLAFGPGHCGAIAPGEVGRPGLGLARKKERAEASAQSFCQQQGGGDCEEVMAACNP